MVRQKNPIFTPFLISLTCLGFGAGFYLRHSQADDDARQAARLLAEVQGKLSHADATRAALEKSREEALAALQTERERLEGELARAQKDHADLLAKLKAAEAKTAASAGTQGPAQRPKAPATMLSEMMKDPAMRDAMKGQQVAMLDMHYGKLFSRFQLSDAEKQDFKNLLSERLQTEFDFAASLMGGDKAPQQIASVSAEQKASLQRIDEKIKTFLNHENDFQTYKHWEETKNERLQLDMGSSAFAAAGEALTAQQEDRLVDAMYKARTAVTGVPDLNKPENFAPQNFTPEMLEKFFKSDAERSAAVLQQAAEFLSPKQVETLKSIQENQRKMQELGLKMLSGGFPGGKK